MTEGTPLYEVGRAAGARFGESAGVVVADDFGDPPGEYRHARESAAVFDVSTRGKVELAGPDAATYVHNLCTNDVLNLPLGGGCEAFFTTAKAKVVSRALIYHVRIAGGRDALWLDVDPGQAPRLLQHLDHFLIAEQVEMADRTAAFSQLHLAGPRADSVLAAALGEAVPELDALQHMERTVGPNAVCHIRRNHPLGVLGYDLVCLRDRAVEVWQRLCAAGAHAAGLSTYEVLRVETGTPVVGQDIDDNRFVVELGRGGAISYSKGCYLGQEPIVMARDRAGHVNRAFRGLLLRDGQAVASGTKLFAADKDVGIVTTSVISPRLGAIALGFVRRGHEQPGTMVELAEAGGREAEVVGLPMN